MNSIIAENEHHQGEVENDEINSADVSPIVKKLFDCYKKFFGQFSILCRYNNVKYMSQIIFSHLNNCIDG